ncbi:Thermophilic serine proteinase precursor [Rubripirellula tenax]|uniref:Thermophilic serine proteinase n=1 Tax=Rubripirellula tenax TaxID=2528015 RepID=A0A5C6FES4_9BACT|nr:S8 family peptidase [Rubripirellula tenax]TWU58616.1 Thermophilic serine proteinase precursor [Rubripirellula tenax]
MRRPLRAEPLEARRLLAAGITNDCESPFAEVSILSDGLVSQTDAGSSRSTAADIGAIDGAVQLSGSLNWFDRVDTIGFTVQRDAQVHIELSNLNRDADIALTDAGGRLLAYSTRAGRGDEVISASLDSGDYFVVVVAQSYRSTRYQLSIDATLNANPAPIQEVDASLPESLASVAYFGGTREWNLNAIDAPEAWAAGYTGAGITVAVVDSGVDLDHPDLVSNLFVNTGEIAGNGIDDDGNGFIDDVHGFDFADGDADPNDVNGHGTHVAGTIAAANNGFGATGVAPDAKILPVRVLNANGSGNTFDVAAGIRYAADLGANIINLSLGGGYSRAIESAIDYARAAGSFIVAAAGNESSSTPGYPARFSAALENVISVGAYSSSGSLAGFSNDVGSSVAVQVDAPGVGIFSTYVGGRYATLSGTSMAAPHVAGLAALTLSANPDLTTRELRDLLASGTVGRAAGSDAIGNVTATTTVAYAAAGVRGDQLGFRSSSSASGGFETSARVRTTSNIDVIGQTLSRKTTFEDAVDEAIVQINDTAENHERRLLVSHTPDRETEASPVVIDDVMDPSRSSTESDTIGLEGLS